MALTMPDLSQILNSINFTKDPDLIHEYNQSDYVPWVINKAMSQHPDTILHANEINLRPNTPKLQQYKYYCNSVTKKKRFGKWLKCQKNPDIVALQQYLNINYRKASEMFPLLSTEELERIKLELSLKGG